LIDRKQWSVGVETLDDLSHIEKPHYTESIFLKKLPPGLRVRVGADGIPNIIYSYYTKEWDFDNIESL
jgi:hypothetical protein